jgi:hypothetical protein
MDRRTFLASSIEAGLAVVFAGKIAAQTMDKAVSANVKRDDLPADLIGENTVSEYFCDQRMHEALGTTQLQKPADVQVVAFNFPSRHPSPFNLHRCLE